MDKLAKRLRDDAEQIDVFISPEMDERIRASLSGIRPEPETASAKALRPFSWWWASSLTGVAAALVVLAVVNLQPPAPVPAITEPDYEPFAMPSIPWRAETALLTSPLEQEFEDLQSDIRKAEEALRQELDAIF